jgi:hypothetical protein
MVGASGAISGVLGAYMTFYPRSKILTLVPIFFFIQFIHIPAAVFIFVWFLIQFLSGLGTLNVPKETGGVAFWAHIEASSSASCLRASSTGDLTPRGADGKASLNQNSRLIFLQLIHII